MDSIYESIYVKIENISQRDIFCVFTYILFYIVIIVYEK